MPTIGTSCRWPPMPAGRRRRKWLSIRAGARRPRIEAGCGGRNTNRHAGSALGPLRWGVVEMAKYLVLSSFTGQTIKRFAAKPSDQAAVVRSLAESVGGSLECYYWMFGQDDGMGIFGQPGSHTMAAVSLAATSSGAFTRFETHEFIEASDLTAVAERAQGIAYQPPGT